MTDESENRRDELCAKFREAIASGTIDSEFFDEDDLIEVFDYAGDLNDDYLRFEVLLCGARLYPTSKSLKERRALLYSTFGEDLSAKYLSDNASQQTPLWDIARIRNANPMGKEADKALNGLLTRYSEFDDEEVIQLVDLASALGRTDWLYDNLDALKAHVTYLPTLLYEIAVMLELVHQYDKAIKLLDELTELEPYNEQYWFMLAQEYDLNDNTAGALQALDLALAILPADKAMRFYQARLFARDDKTTAQAISALETLSDEYPDDIDISRFLASLYLESDPESESADAKARAVLARCFRKNPGDRGLATDLLIIDDMHDDEIIKAVDSHQPPTDLVEWIAWSEELKNAEAYTKAIKVLLYCERKNGKSDILISKELIYNYFLNKNFKEVCAIFESNRCKEPVTDQGEVELIFVMYAISLAKIKAYKDAGEFSSSVLKYIFDEIEPDVKQTLRRFGTGMVLTDIAERCKTPGKTDWAKYDPLSVWHNA